MANNVRTDFDRPTMSVAEAAAYIGVSYNSMNELTRREDFPVLCVGRKKLIPRAAFLEWMNSQRYNQHSPSAE